MKFSILIALFVVVTTAQVKAQGPSPAADVEPVYGTVDVMPEYPGGYDACFSYLKTNLVYPEKAFKARNYGTMYVDFIIEKTGQVTNATISRTFPGEGSEDCEKEALRLIMAMPKWKPGKDEGKLVRVKYTLPVRYILK